PGTDGVEFIRRQMAIRPVPIVVLSIATESSERVLSALDAGAVDFVQKPTALASEKVLDIADDLVARVCAAAASVARVGRPAASRAAATAPAVAKRFDVVVIGTSTGGPQSLKVVISRLPGDFPVPIGVVLHMPIGYTEGYARRLDEISPLHVIEARDGDDVRPGCVFVAPAGRHLTFVRHATGSVRIHLDVSPLDHAHRPAVGGLFQSPASSYRAQ